MGIDLIVVSPVAFLCSLSLRWGIGDEPKILLRLLFLKSFSIWVPVSKVMQSTSNCVQSKRAIVKTLFFIPNHRYTTQFKLLEPFYPSTVPSLRYRVCLLTLRPHASTFTVDHCGAVYLVTCAWYLEMPNGNKSSVDSLAPAFIKTTLLTMLQLISYHFNNFPLTKQTPPPPFELQTLQPLSMYRKVTFSIYVVSKEFVKTFLCVGLACVYA